jgi:pyroglutamyl-peptidase
MTIILVTGFGPFPGAPFNPTEALVTRLARTRRPALRDVRIVPHIFTTSYSTVDRDLPALIAAHKPDALLMFGLASRTKWIRIETRARNALAMLPDATSAALARHTIAAGGPAARTMQAPVQHLLAAARDAAVPVALSRDAGRYLCNYLCWQAAGAVGRDRSANSGPRLAAFIHVPLVHRSPRPRRDGMRRFAHDDLARAGTRILLALAAAARR